MAGRPLLAQPLIDWLLTDARRIAEPKAFVAALAKQFLAHGIDVSRLVTGVPILHPQVHSYSARWDLGQGSSERFFRLTAETLPVLENSPVKTVYTGGGSVRCDPTAPPREGEFNILSDLRREGVTDYVALSLPFSDGTTKLLAVATRRSGGFSDDQMAPVRGCWRGPSSAGWAIHQRRHLAVRPARLHQSVRAAAARRADRAPQRLFRSHVYGT
jgi:adenylate cyclase